MSEEYNIIFPTWFDFYIEPENVSEWNTCSKCGYKPKIWVFDNGRHASCACAKEHSKYGHLTVSCESIGVLARRTGGDITDYDSDGLRKAWNKHMENFK